MDLLLFCYERDFMMSLSGMRTQKLLKVSILDIWMTC